MATLRTAFSAESREGNTLKGIIVIEEGFARGHYCVMQRGKLVEYDGSIAEHIALARQKVYPILADNTTLNQVKGEAEGRAVRCELNHADDLGETLGTLGDFTISQTRNRSGKMVNAVKGTYSPLFTEDQSKDDKKNGLWLCSMAAQCPDEFGCSIKYEDYYELGKMNGRDVALMRCSGVSTIDIVDKPALTSKILSAKQIEDFMNIEEIREAALSAIKEGLPAALQAELKPFGERLGKMESKMKSLSKENAKLKAKMEEGDNEEDPEKKKDAKSDEEGGDESEMSVDEESEGEDEEEEKPKNKDDKKMRAIIAEEIMKAGVAHRIKTNRTIPAVRTNATMSEKSAPESADTFCENLARTKYAHRPKDERRAWAMRDMMENNEELYKKLTFL